jgi:hypothetical protein
VVTHLPAVLGQHLEVVEEAVVDDLQRLAHVIAAANHVDLFEARAGMPLDIGVEQLDAGVDVGVLECAPEAEPDGYVVFLGACLCRGGRSHPGSIAMLRVGSAAIACWLRSPP